MRKRQLRAVKCGLLPLTAALVFGPAVAANVPLAPLRIQVVDDQGARLGGVEVRVLGAETEEVLVTPWDGDLAVEKSPGTYDLRFSLNDYYDLVVRGVEIAPIPEPRTGSSPASHLRVMMIPKVHFERDLVIVGPTYVEAPLLRVSFQATNPVENQQARGTVTITNVGDQAQIVPLGREFKWTPETLLMRLQVEIEGSDVWYDQPFVCEPSKKTCRELQPGQSVDVPIELQSRASYGRPEWQPARWDAGGEPLDGVVRAYLVYPESGGDPERRGAYTREVEAAFEVTVNPGPFEVKP